VTKSQQSKYGRIGAYRQRAGHDPRQMTLAARQTFLARFYKGIPEGLSHGEREARAAAARRAYFLGLAIKSAKARVTRRGR
jgi:hypothetical protein